MHVWNMHVCAVERTYASGVQTVTFTDLFLLVCMREPMYCKCPLELRLHLYVYFNYVVEEPSV